MKKIQNCKSIKVQILKKSKTKTLHNSGCPKIPGLITNQQNKPYNDSI